MGGWFSDPPEHSFHPSGSADDRARRPRARYLTHWWSRGLFTSASGLWLLRRLLLLCAEARSTLIQSNRRTHITSVSAPIAENT